MSRTKWTYKTQAYFLVKCAELLAEGFVMEEVLQFLELIMPKQKEALRYVTKMMKIGQRFDQTLHKLNFKQSVIAQIYLAQENGQFIQVLHTCGKEIETRHHQLNKLRRLCVYPLILLAFVLLLLFGIRQFFLPQLMQLSEKQNALSSITVMLIKELPSIIGGIIFGFLGLFTSIKLVYRHKSALERVVLLCKIRPFREWIKLYYTAYFSRELAYFYENGYSLSQIVHLLKNGNTSLLLKDFACVLESYAQTGNQLHDTLKHLSFLKEEMLYIVQHGEKISQLPLKLTVFSKDCFTRLEKDIELKLTFIQPIMFLIVGIIVVLVYLTLMLPMLSLVDTLLS
ncbi:MULTISPECIES: competence type IV pilus assembly protein ComGB [unclassified Granulicatella]|uniref:competence type IV pilus assembly protein ComGB n=1 Tax=unclassified Granulicatella TaxID=2630493 RepID=UPI001073AD5A|nr:MULTISPECIES: competence type IV pilus assembly protein ComGB [unclassified Granulicatella]MBF0780552.1 type II secretion system F family protein [Granulicatella sp. 19428wC4_WM01]TFU94906.1 hypothetical protein E4T68_05525 [Granulicatella sp. WM01]